MNYCPDCDMEFIDEVKICSDCGKPLVDKERYLAEKKCKDAEKSNEEATEQLPVRNESPCPSPAVYVKRAERYEDLKSSASAFLIVGIVTALLSILSFGKILHLPISIPSTLMLRILFLFFTAGSFFVYKKTTSDAEKVHGEIALEQEKTERLIHWFLNSHTAESVDQIIQSEHGSLRPEILSLKRMEYIQDIFLTNHDLSDPSYADALSEEVYAKLYES